MKIEVPMSTRERIRDFVTDAPWGTIEEIAELHGLALDPEKHKDEDCGPEIGDDDFEQLLRALLSGMLLEEREALHIDRASLPGLMELKGATMEEPRLRTLYKMGLNPDGILLAVSLIDNLEISLVGGPYDGINIEFHNLEHGTLAEPGGRISAAILTPTIHWEDDFVRVLKQQIPNVIMPHYEGRPFDDLVDHPLTRGLGLVISGLETNVDSLNAMLKPARQIEIMGYGAAA